jgi:ATP-dependent RNA helicase DDX54/DBP10
VQTWKFIKELGKHMDLRTALVLGGDSMEHQFEAIHENPDIIVATPGRLLHLVVEMDLSLSTVEYVVFDECDRLFEMGFEEQIQELIGRFPAQRQTCLFSATLPKLLLEFAKVRTDPYFLFKMHFVLAGS